MSLALNSSKMQHIPKTQSKNILYNTKTLTMTVFIFHTRHIFLIKPSATCHRVFLEWVYVLLQSSQGSKDFMHHCGNVRTHVNRDLSLCSYYIIKLLVETKMWSPWGTH